MTAVVTGDVARAPRDLEPVATPGETGRRVTAWHIGARAPHRTGAPPVTLALLGTGAVGSAFLRRLQEVGQVHGQRLTLVHAANSRTAVTAPAGIDPAGAWLSVADSSRRSRLDDVDAALVGASPGPRAVVDATASADVALRHAYWLERGTHVITACKIATGGPLSQAWRVAGAAQRGGASYGDSATVGAGLPVLRTIRDLRRGGDQILSICGVLFGSLAWLLDRYDGARPIRELVAHAQTLGLTEPDPRIDLSGEDVRRKLLILTRAAGVSLEPADITVEPLTTTDETLRNRLTSAQAEGRVLRYVARWDRTCARVGLESLPAHHPVAIGHGCDNRVAIHSSRYQESPLVLQGPGAGADVTAAALLDDVLRVAGG